MSKSHDKRIPWPKCPTDEIDPGDPLSSDWGYLSFDPATCRPVFDETTRPSDHEILVSPICLVLASLVDDGEKT